MVKKFYVKEMKCTQYWPESLPSFRVEVTDELKGIFLGNHVVDDVIALEMAATLTEAANHFTKIYEDSKK